MKKIALVFLTLTFVISTTLFVTACSVNDFIKTRYFTFTLLTDDTYEITAKDTTNLPSKFVIPSSYNGKPVTRIGKDAFSGCSGLTSVTIPNSVTNIGDFAFKNCSGLTSITIGNGVTIIGYMAFFNCSGLTSIEIPSSVTSIGSGAFSYCSGLTSITIPNSVTRIGVYAFEYCSGLTSVTIPNSVTSIGSKAFSGCNNLKYNEYDNGYYLGNQENPYHVLIKAKSTDIISCEINSRTKVISSSAFEGCIVLSVSFFVNSKLLSIGDYAFNNCGLWSITIPNSVTSIGKGAFENCSSLRSVYIPNSVTSISDCAFEYCSGLTSVTFENPNGWWVSQDSTATSGMTISSDDLSDPSTAANYLKLTYIDYNWKRS